MKFLHISLRGLAFSVRGLHFSIEGLPFSMRGPHFSTEGNPLLHCMDSSEGTQLQPEGTSIQHEGIWGDFVSALRKPHFIIEGTSLKHEGTLLEHDWSSALRGHHFSTERNPLLHCEDSTSAWEYFTSALREPISVLAILHFSRWGLIFSMQSLPFSMREFHFSMRRLHCSMRGLHFMRGFHSAKDFPQA